MVLWSALQLGKRKIGRAYDLCQRSEAHGCVVDLSLNCIECQSPFSVRTVCVEQRHLRLVKDKQGHKSPHKKPSKAEIFCAQVDRLRRKQDKRKAEMSHETSVQPDPLEIKQREEEAKFRF